MMSSSSDELDLTCDSYVANVTALVRLAQLAIQAAVRDRRKLVNDTDQTFVDIRTGYGGISIDSFVTDILAPSVCIFGAVGNLLNLFILTRRRLRRSMDGLERSVRLGLVALAVSDELFCVAYLVTVCFRPNGAKHLYSPYDGLATLYLSVYHEVRLDFFYPCNFSNAQQIAICISNK
jgi:hypothetical protein